MVKSIIPMRTIYRDTKTGRYVSKQTWKRSESGRYKRQRQKLPQKPPQAPPPGLPTREWIVAYTYIKTGRSFDVVVTARTETEAYEVAHQFLRDDKNGQKITRANFIGWSERAAEGEITDHEPGEAEYRDRTRVEGETEEE